VRYYAEFEHEVDSFAARARDASQREHELIRRASSAA
jgi:hypothetical protein